MESLKLKKGRAWAEMYLHGAHVTRVEMGGEPLIFLSEKAVFAEGEPIRGGIPVCFPWFGPNKTNASLPSHGFARTREWRLVDRGEDFAVMTLKSDAKSRAMWPHEFEAVYRVQLLEDALLLDFHVTNVGSTAFKVETALHTYFAVSNVRRVSVEGLDGKTYIDQLDGKARKTQQGDVTFEGEVDRDYLNAPGPVRLRDGDGRAIRITGEEGCRSTVVWNPWVAKSKVLKDLGDEEWPKFVCVESGFIEDDAVTLEAGEEHRLLVEVVLTREE